MAASQAEGAAEVTVDRAASEGKIVIASVSENALEAADTLEVMVDGEAVVEASSQSELEGAFGSDESRYMVVGGGSAEATTKVLVAVNHFSERTITMTSAGRLGRQR